MYTIQTLFKCYTLTPIPLPAAISVQEVKRHHIILDRSGSMYYDLRPIVDLIRGVAQTASGDLLTSLSSFSSHDDYTLHWTDVTWRQVNEEPFSSELDRIQPTALTCMSQALAQAVEIAGHEIPTVITVFTDGYANDPGPRQEGADLWSIAQRVKESRPNIAINMIGYRDWCDWPFMGKIANETGGQVIKATTAEAVHAAISEQHAALAGVTRPTIVLDRDGPVLVINRSTGSAIYSANGKARIIGVGKDDELLAFDVREVDQARSSLPKDQMWIAAALAKGLVCAGDLRHGKYVLCSTGNKTLWEEHSTALTPSTIAGMVSDLTEWIRRGNNDGYEMGRNVLPEHNILDLVGAVEQVSSGEITVNMGRLWKGYRRRSEKKHIGERLESGEIAPPPTKLSGVGPTILLGLDLNDADASIQIKTVTKKRLKNWDGKDLSPEQRGSVNVDTDDMGEFRSYTIMSCGERNIEILPLVAHTQAAYDALWPFLDAKSKPPFDRIARVDLKLKKFMAEAQVVQDPDQILAIVAQRFEAKARTKYLTAMAGARGAGADCPEEEVAARKVLAISRSGYYNPPTTTAHPNRDQDIRTGALDAFTRYSILFGLTSLMDPEKIESGNKASARRYEMILPNSTEPVPANLSGWRLGASFHLKAKSPAKGKAKPEPAHQALMNRIGDEIVLRYQDSTDKGRASNLLSSEIKAASKQEEDAAAALRPLVIEIGCTGLLPIELEEKAEKIDANDFAERFGTKVSSEGLYYVFGNGLAIGIVPSVEWYTVRYEPAVYAGGIGEDEIEESAG